MTNGEIMKLAHAAGWQQGSQFDDCGHCSRFDVVAFARMVAAATEAENEALRIDAECFRFWVREAAQAPGAMAALIMSCTTEQEYRDAIIPVMMKSKAAISRAMGE